LSRRRASEAAAPQGIPPGKLDDALMRRALAFRPRLGAARVLREGIRGKADLEFKDFAAAVALLVLALYAVAAIRRNRT
jgi:hypothetical protein